jgi:hypothetical protein
MQIHAAAKTNDPRAALDAYDRGIAEGGHRIVVNKKGKVSHLYNA